MASMSDHLATLNRYLHDSANRYFSETDKTAYLNQGIKQRDMVTGGNRTLVSLVLTAGVDTYTFSTLGNTRVFDVVGINLLYNGLRLVLDQRSFTKLNAEVRVYSPVWQYAPMAWARYGPATVVFGPAPSIAYTTEWDCCQVSADLTLSDDDPLPYPYSEIVPYYAAYLAKLNERQYEEARGFWEQYRQMVNAALSSRAGMLPSAYPGGGLVGR